MLEAEPEVGGKSLTVYDDAQPSVPQESLGWGQQCLDLMVWTGWWFGGFSIQIVNNSE